MVQWHEEESVMFDDPVPANLRRALIDRFDPEEFIELLGITVEDLVDAFEDKIEENLADVKEALGMADEGELDYGD